MTRLIVRADATSRTGMGHLTRCLALIEAWRRRGGEATVLTAAENDLVMSRIIEAGAVARALDRSHPDPMDLNKTLELLRFDADESGSVPWLVLDGYDFDPVYQAAIREAHQPVLVIDDMAHHDRYHASVLLNQNIDAGTLKYESDEDTLCLLGTDYILLGSQFLSRGPAERDVPPVAQRILVTLGASDPHQITSTVVAALRSIDQVAFLVRVVVGATNRNMSSVAQSIEEASDRHHFELVHDSRDMPALMTWADLAVSAGGSTTWELAYMGVPSVVLVLADNQAAVAGGLDRAGVALSLGPFSERDVDRLSQAIWQLACDPERRRGMRQRGRALVDGGGAGRVVDALLARGRM